jgi:hypothetical protein
MAEDSACLVCGRQYVNPPGSRGDARDLKYFDCAFCGQFGLFRHAQARIRSWMREGDPESKGPILAHALRRAQLSNEWPVLDAGWVERVITSGSLPEVQEQADNILRWIGDRFGPGADVTLRYDEHGAIFGMRTPANFALVVDALSGLFNSSRAGHETAKGHLTFNGWQRVYELRKGAPSGRKAFMAMQYGDLRLDGIVDQCFRPAVAATGFELRRLDDEQRAGLIDDQMRLEIQGARFVIVDLTKENRGAYWEAGYAEGLQKPVIYTCEASEWTKHTTHFDTNHHLHILWEADKLEEAARKLTAVIRVTIPEARRED